MKNQYVGDIGDYTKLGMLRVIQNAGFSLGINWYLTPNDNRTDGIHTEYLHKQCDTPDATLHSVLKEVVANGLRSVEELENRKLFSNAIYYNRVLGFINCSNRKIYRDLWHKEAVRLLKSQDVIFLDPDNGLEVKSHKPHSVNGNKFITYQEAADYFRAGANVVVYNHRDRSPEQKYLERFNRFKEIDGLADAELFCVKASRFSVRDYLFISQAKHTSRLKAAISDMLKTGWNKYLSFREM